jgi:hypothetical protein
MSDTMGQGATGAVDAPRKPSGETFRDPTPLLHGVAGLLILCAIATLVAILFRALEFKLLSDIAAGVYAGRDDLMQIATDSDARVVTSGYVRAGLFILTSIPFGMWIYRANKNARALGAEGMRHSAGWAVGSYFVPIVNFFAPFTAMREIWRASADPGNWTAAPGTPLLGWWWFLWLAAAISGQAAQMLLGNPSGAEMAQLGSLVAFSQNLFHLGLYIVAYLLLRRITEKQVWQARIAQVF